MSGHFISVCLFFFSVIRIFSAMSEKDLSFLITYLNHRKEKKVTPGM